MAMQRDMVRLLSQENLSKIHNLSGYIVGMLVKFRKRFINTQQGGRSPSRGRSPRRSSPRPRSPRRDSPSRRSPYSRRSYRERSPHDYHRSSRYDYYRRSPSPSRYYDDYYHHYRRHSRSPPHRSSYHHSPSRHSSPHRYHSPPRHSRSPRRGASPHHRPRSPPHHRRSPRRGSPQHSSPSHPSYGAPKAAHDERGRPSSSSAMDHQQRLPSKAPVMPEIPPSLRQSWFFAERNQGVKLGPFPAEQIRREWERGMMDPSWLAWHAGMETWQEIRTLPILVCYLTGAPVMNGGANQRKYPGDSRMP